MKPEDLAHGLRRLADYGQALAQPDRDLLKAAAEAIQPTSPRDYESLDCLMRLVADPAATKRRLDALRATAAEGNAAIAAADSAAAELGAKRAQFENELAAHRRVIETERAAHETDMKRQAGEVRAQQLEAGALLSRAKMDATDAAELKRDLEQRLAQMRALAK